MTQAPFQAHSLTTLGSKKPGQVKAMRPDVPIIMITAYGDAETKRKALENGAEALLTKPIDFGTLRSEIETRVKRTA
jgi:DNA-binding response OmpR family regulator